jgi:hypothetical protein
MPPTYAGYRKLLGDELAGFAHTRMDEADRQLVLGATLRLDELMSGLDRVALRAVRAAINASLPREVRRVYGLKAVTWPAAARVVAIVLSRITPARRSPRVVHYKKIANVARAAIAGGMRR